MLGCPFGEAAVVELLQIAEPEINNRNGIMPEVGRRRCGLPRVGRQPPDRRSDILADQVDHGVHIDAPGHVTDEEHQGRDADEGEKDTDGEREMWDELALALGADAAQHHQRVGEGAEEGPERDLIAAIPGEIPQ